MLTQLSIHQLRNLNAVNIHVGQCNVFVGANGSGKTSLLESLFLLSRGKSFRHHQPKRYISHHAPSTTVHAKFANGQSMAIQKAQDASSQMRLDQQPVYVQSALAKQLPALLIDPSSMDILEVGSGSRRQLLDWVTFHVKPGFHSQWLSYQRLLKQRNALLKQTPRLSMSQKQELVAWDKGLANHAALITHYRQATFEQWQPQFDALIKQLLPDYAPFIQLRFLPGYDASKPLDELLFNRLDQDCQMGYTRIGCHRADVQVLWVDDASTRQQYLENHLKDNDSQLYPTSNSDADIEIENKPNNTPINFPINTPNDTPNESGLNAQIGDGDYTENQDLDNNEYVDKEPNKYGTLRELATNVLSRGEKKLLITALRLSQLPLLHKEGSLPLVLLDDITAELDGQALTILLQTLKALSCQVFITSLDDDVIDELQEYWPDVQMFHVKQGTIEPRAN